MPEQPTFMVQAEKEAPCQGCVENQALRKENAELRVRVRLLELELLRASGARVGVDHQRRTSTTMGVLDLNLEKE